MYLVAIKTRKVFKVIIFTKKQTSFVGNIMYVHGNYKCLGNGTFSKCYLVSFTTTKVRILELKLIIKPVHQCLASVEALPMIM